MSNMDIDSDGTTKRKSCQSVPKHVDEEFHQANGSEHVGSVFATRTNTAMNKYQQKRLGAKKAKKLEVAANSSCVLSPSDATV